jgi:hypothetical protein
MKPIEIRENGKGKAILVTKDSRKNDYILYYMNSEEDIFHLYDELGKYIKNTFPYSTKRV